MAYHIIRELGILKEADRIVNKPEG